MQINTPQLFTAFYMIGLLLAACSPSSLSSSSASDTAKEKEDNRIATVDFIRSGLARYSMNIETEIKTTASKVVAFDLTLIAKDGDVQADCHWGHRLSFSASDAPDATPLRAISCTGSAAPFAAANADALATYRTVSVDAPAIGSTAEAALLAAGATRAFLSDKLVRKYLVTPATLSDAELLVAARDLLPDLGIGNVGMVNMPYIRRMVSAAANAPAFPGILCMETPTKAPRRSASGGGSSGSGTSSDSPNGSPDPNEGSSKTPKPTLLRRARQLARFGLTMLGYHLVSTVIGSLTQGNQNKPATQAPAQPDPAISIENCRASYDLAANYFKNRPLSRVELNAMVLTNAECIKAIDAVANANEAAANASPDATDTPEQTTIFVDDDSKNYHPCVDLLAMLGNAAANDGNTTIEADIKANYDALCSAQTTDIQPPAEQTTSP